MRSCVRFVVEQLVNDVERSRECSLGSRFRGILIILPTDCHCRAARYAPTKSPLSPIPGNVTLRRGKCLPVLTKDRYGRIIAATA